MIRDTSQEAYDYIVEQEILSGITSTVYKNEEKIKRLSEVYYLLRPYAPSHIQAAAYKILCGKPVDLD